eukprot:TRINITY_DN890_c0_g1_i1.p1 TRINITY_DN890_c0_g1~~TRINITY_DN890_c0_g1_i1.p1  ORF type:complete len:1438 (-),score=153.69 TRINITY_DN890_c0_g1_i1:1592-5905(-)
MFHPIRRCLKPTPRFASPVAPVDLPLTTHTIPLFIPYETPPPAGSKFTQIVPHLGMLVYHRLGTASVPQSFERYEMDIGIVTSLRMVPYCATKSSLAPRKGDTQQPPEEWRSTGLYVQTMFKKLVSASGDIVAEPPSTKKSFIVMVDRSLACGAPHGALAAGPPLGAVVDAWRAITYPYNLRVFASGGQPYNGKRTVGNVSTDNDTPRLMATKHSLVPTWCSARSCAAMAGTGWLTNVRTNAPKLSSGNPVSRRERVRGVVVGVLGRRVAVRTADGRCMPVEVVGMRIVEWPPSSSDPPKAYVRALRDSASSTAFVGSAAERLVAERYPAQAVPVGGVGGAPRGSSIHTFRVTRPLLSLAYPSLPRVDVLPLASLYPPSHSDSPVSVDLPEPAADVGNLKGPPMVEVVGMPSSSAPISVGSVVYKGEWCPVQKRTTFGNMIFPGMDMGVVCDVEHRSNRGQVRVGVQFYSGFWSGPLSALRLVPPLLATPRPTLPPLGSRARMASQKAPTVVASLADGSNVSLSPFQWGVVVGYCGPKWPVPPSYQVMGAEGTLQKPAYAPPDLPLKIVVAYNVMGSTEMARVEVDPCDVVCKVHCPRDDYDAVQGGSFLQMMAACFGTHAIATCYGLDAAAPFSCVDDTAAPKTAPRWVVGQVVRAPSAAAAVRVERGPTSAGAVSNVPEWMHREVSECQTVQWGVRMWPSTSASPPLKRWRNRVSEWFNVPKFLDCVPSLPCPVLGRSGCDASEVFTTSTSIQQLDASTTPSVGSAARRSAWMSTRVLKLLSSGQALEIALGGDQSVMPALRAFGATFQGIKPTHLRYLDYDSVGTLGSAVTQNNRMFRGSTVSPFDKIFDGMVVAVDGSEAIATSMATPEGPWDGSPLPSVAPPSALHPDYGPLDPLGRVIYIHRIAPVPTAARMREAAIGRMMAPDGCVWGPPVVAHCLTERTLMISNTKTFSDLMVEWGAPHDIRQAVLAMRNRSLSMTQRMAIGQPCVVGPLNPEHTDAITQTLVRSILLAWGVPMDVLQDKKPSPMSEVCPALFPNKDLRPEWADLGAGLLGAVPLGIESSARAAVVASTAWSRGIAVAFCDGSFVVRKRKIGAGAGVVIVDPSSDVDPANVTTGVDTRMSSFPMAYRYAIPLPLHSNARAFNADSDGFVPVDDAEIPRIGRVPRWVKNLKLPCLISMSEDFVSTFAELCAIVLAMRWATRPNHVVPLLLFSDSSSARAVVMAAAGCAQVQDHSARLRGLFAMVGTTGDTRKEAYLSPKEASFRMSNKGLVNRTSPSSVSRSMFSTAKNMAAEVAFQALLAELVEILAARKRASTAGTLRGPAEYDSFGDGSFVVVEDVPGHSGIAPHEAADMAAHDASSGLVLLQTPAAARNSTLAAHHEARPPNNEARRFDGVADTLSEACYDAILPQEWSQMWSDVRSRRPTGARKH